MKKHMMKRSVRGLTALTLALITAMISEEAAHAAYWNRGRNHRGGNDDSGGQSSGGGDNSRGRDLDGDGIPNISDPDIDNDGVPNGLDSNVDGGIAVSGKFKGKYIGDRLPNGHPGERDIDDDGLSNDSPAELDIDGDGVSNASDDDIDGDGILNADDTDDDGDGIADADDATPSGAVSVTNPPIPPGRGPVGDGTAPAALTGIVYEIREPGGRLESTLSFATATAGSEAEDGDHDSFTYTYTANGTKASLRLQLKTDRWNEYDLDYATGGFTRREFDRNVLKDTDTGSFNLSGATPPVTPPVITPTPVGDGTAPASAEGITWVVKEKNGHVEANLVFTSATAGTENDPDGDVDSFTYTYTPNGTTAMLRLQFKVDKWDEYDLDFATGHFTRREFKHNALDDTDTGIFALPPSNP